MYKGREEMLFMYITTEARRGGEALFLHEREVALATTLDDAAFAEGFGFDGSSVRGWKTINASDMLVMPDASSAIIDPVQHVAVRSAPGASPPPGFTDTRRHRLRGSCGTSRSILSRLEPSSKEIRVGRGHWFLPRRSHGVGEGISAVDTVGGR